MSKSVGNVHPGRQGDRAVRRRRPAALRRQHGLRRRHPRSASAASRRCRRPTARSATRSATCWATSRTTQRFDPASVDPPTPARDRPLGARPAQPGDPRRPGGLRAIRVLPGLSADLPVLLGRAVELLPRRAQGPALRRGRRRPRPPRRAVRAGPAARRPDAAAGPDHPAHGRGVVGLPARRARQAGERPSGRVPAARPAVGRPEPRRAVEELLDARETMLCRPRRACGRTRRSAAPRKPSSRIRLADDLPLLDANRDLLATLCIVSEVEIVRRSRRGGPTGRCQPQPARLTPSASGAGTTGRPSARTPSIRRSASGASACSATDLTRRPTTRGSCALQHRANGHFRGRGSGAAPGGGRRRTGLASIRFVPSFNGPTRSSTRMPTVCVR